MPWASVGPAGLSGLSGDVCVYVGGPPRVFGTFPERVLVPSVQSDPGQLLLLLSLRDGDGAAPLLRPDGHEWRGIALAHREEEDELDDGRASGDRYLTGC